MILYRYETYEGQYTLKDQILKPKKVINDSFCPNLVYLTSNPKWNEIIVANTLVGGKPIRAKSPKVFTKRGIPCWKFEVEVKESLHKYMYPHPGWLAMLRIAKEKGCDLSEWHWVRYECPILTTYTWNGWWKPTDV